MSVKTYVKGLCSKYCFFKRFYSFKNQEINRIAIIYYIPKTNIEKYNNWEDGFTKAINLLEKDFQVTWINLEDSKPTAKELNEFDFLIVKSCWDWIVDRYVRSLKELKVIRGIAISCSKKPFSRNSIFFYDVLWYETEWYGLQLKNHPRTFQAFGINSEKFFEQDLIKEIDVLSIGTLATYKRHHYILKEKGKTKVIIGDINTNDSKSLKEEFSQKGVNIIDYKTQEELSKIINQSKLVYIPSEINGGGERAVLEARACNTKVKVEQDNPKLLELLTSKIWTEIDYYEGLLNGINSMKN